MWSNQTHIAYLILWIRLVFNKAPPIFLRYIFHWRCLGKFTVSLAFKVSFPQVVPYCRRADLKTWVQACLVASSWLSNLNLIC